MANLSCVGYDYNKALSYKAVSGGKMKVGSLVTSKYHYSMGVVLSVDTHYGDGWACIKWIKDTHLDPFQYIYNLEVICK